MLSNISNRNFTDSYWVNEGTRIGYRELLGVISDEVEMSVDYLWDFCIYRNGINLTEFNRAMSVDTSYPLIVSVDNGVEMIIDGHRRIYKARFFCMDKLKVRVLDLKSAPDKFRIFKR